MGIIFYHNARCSKSREALGLLEEMDVDFELRNYVKEPLQKTEIKDIIESYIGELTELIRIKDDAFKDNYKQKSLSKKEVIEILTKHPMLMERPIIMASDKSTVIRPIQKILLLNLK